MRSWQDVHSVVMDRVKQYRAENFHARKTDTCELYPAIFLATVNEKYDAEGKDELKAARVKALATMKDLLARA
jgi:hypothetical protein